MELVVILFWKLNVPNLEKTVKNYLTNSLTNRLIREKYKEQINLQMLAAEKCYSPKGYI